MTKNSLKQVLRLHDVLKIAYADTPYQWSNSGTKPPAHYATLCELQSASAVLSKKIMRVISLENPLPVMTKAIIELMFLNGLRISEVLKIKGSDISENGNIYIRASKGSQNRWAVSGLYRQYWCTLRAMPYEIGMDYSRFYFYREFKKLGITSYIEGNKNQAVTHCFRHLLVTTSQRQVKDLEASKKQLGHKSIKSTQHYDSSKQKKK